MRDVFQRKGYIVRGAEALLGVLLQAVAYDALQGGRNVPASFGKIRRVFLQNGDHRVCGCSSLEGSLSREHLIQNGADGEDVGSRIGFQTADLFRGHIADSAEHHPGSGAHRCGWHTGLSLGSRRLVAHELRQAEIEKLDAPFPRDKMFSGFRSRWTIPLSWAAASAP